MTYLFNNQVDFVPTVKDAFGRLITTQPLTLFDSSHRYRANRLWASYISDTDSTVTFNEDQGLIDLNIGTNDGDEIIRETIKVFPYQPGKALTILNTFVMEPAKAGLRQRVGYFGAENGFYVELDGSNLYLVKRSKISGTVENTRIAQSSWNGDKLDGTGASGKTLAIDKAQIFFTDIEWLGVGSVRMGFIIDGQYYIAHTFHHANSITSTYMTTASLPLRYEITNTAATASSSNLKQICSTVLSMGGYELRGLQVAAGHPINVPRNIGGSAGDLHPVISIRLKNTRLDGIAILSAIDFLPKTSATYRWRLIGGATTSGGAWINPGDTNIVEYNLTATGYSGGRELATGYVATTNQSGGRISIPKESLFQFQLERDSLNGVRYELMLVISADVISGGGNDIYASLDWEEISR